MSTKCVLLDYSSPFELWIKKMGFKYALDKNYKLRVYFDSYNDLFDLGYRYGKSLTTEIHHYHETIIEP